MNSEVLKQTNEGGIMHLRPEVQKFAEAMERQLRENDDKGGWADMPEKYLILRTIEELGEVMTQLIIEDGRYGLLQEAADVANFLMMICDNRGYLSPKERR